MRTQLARDIYNTSYIQGQFRLRSGSISNEYFDKYLFESEPHLLKEIVNEMSQLIPEETEVIAGLELGGIPIVTALSLITNNKACYVRKKPKEYGTCRIAEGAEISGKNVCIIEDVVSTGGQIIKSVKELRNQGAIITTVLCVIQRNKVASENLAKEGLELKPLFAMEYMKAQL
jgi:orotate phosphoribosyltransferase